MSYQNPLPIISGNNFSCNIFCNPDPFVIKYKGKYYCYSSGENGIAVLESDNLQSFSHCGYAYQSKDEHSYWGPSVFYWNGTFYLYYSSLAVGKTEDHEHFMKVLVSQDPLGPFKFAKLLIPHFAIDPHVIHSGGKMYLFYSENIIKNIQTGHIGTVVKMRRMSSPLVLQNNVHTVLLPTLDQEIFSRNRFESGEDWYTLEGAFYFERNCTRYLMYSGNAYTSKNYFIGYATAPISTPLEETSFTKYPNNDTYYPLVKGCGSIVGTGHNSVVKAPDNVTDVIVYHGIALEKTPQININERRICADILREQDGILLTKAPTCGPQPDLPQPDFKACFTKRKMSWIHSVGKWNFIDKELKGKGTGYIIFTSELGCSYYLEMWTFVKEGNAGFLLQSELLEEGIRIGANLKNGCICISQFWNDREKRLKFPVSESLRPLCYHKFSIRCSGGIISFYIDNTKQISLFEGKTLTSAGCYVANGEMKIATFDMTNLN